MAKKTIQKAKAQHEMQLLGIKGVTGVGIGEEDGRKVIKVYVVRKTKSLKNEIPDSINGFPVSIEATDEINILPA
jgi:hypothetical protein